MAPNTFGVSVFTRPPRISGAPDHEAIGVTGMPASCRCFAVPPVERISTFRAASARARSMMPLLSETERMARSMVMAARIIAKRAGVGERRLGRTAARAGGYDVQAVKSVTESFQS